MSSVRTRGSWLLAVPLFLAAGCSGPAPPEKHPDPEDVIKAATQRLTDHCLSRQGFVPPRPGQSPTPEQQKKVSGALFGAGPAQLSVDLPTGYVVRAHTDGCLAAAQQRLYGDQPGWFRASVIVNNLKPEAAGRTRPPLTSIEDAGPHSGRPDPPDRP